MEDKMTYSVEIKKLRKEFGSKVDAACGQLRANQN